MPAAGRNFRKRQKKAFRLPDLSVRQEQFRFTDVCLSLSIMFFAYLVKKNFRAVQITFVHKNFENILPCSGNHDM